MPTTPFHGDGVEGISEPLSCLRKPTLLSLGDRGWGFIQGLTYFFFFLKGQVVNTLGLADLTISVTTTQHYRYNTKAIGENT